MSDLVNELLASILRHTTSKDKLFESLNLENRFHLSRELRKTDPLWLKFEEVLGDHR